MTLNLILFLIGSSAFYGIWWLLRNKEGPWGCSGYLWRHVIAMLLFVPWNVNGDVYTVFGNGTSEGSFYAIGSFYQEAPVRNISLISPITVQRGAGDAYSFAGLFVFQFPAMGDAHVGFGGLVVQDPNGDAWTGVGLGVVQGNGGTTTTPVENAYNGISFMGAQIVQNDAWSLFRAISLTTLAGENASAVIDIVSIVQLAGEDALIWFGISVYQAAELDDAVLLLGMSGYQHAAESESVVGVGVGIYQRGWKNIIGFGLGGYQDADGYASTVLGMTVMQRAGERKRPFAVLSMISRFDADDD